MHYNFDEIINRHGTDSVKWDLFNIFLRCSCPEKFALSSRIAL